MFGFSYMKTPAFKARRKPQQSRARMTQGALLESFVRLLDTQDYPDITIRDITELAGVGLGTFMNTLVIKMNWPHFAFISTSNSRPEP